MATVALSGIITPTNVVTATSTTTLSNKTLVAPALGTPASGVVTNLTGTASININGTVGATTPSTVVATTVKASTTMSVGGATPSASGSGISFPATQSASSDANTLDDYEEGTWTPTIYGSSTAGTGTYDKQDARYIKIGGAVSFVFDLLWTAHTGTGDMNVAGLPFTVNVHAAIAPGYVDNITLTASNILQSLCIDGSTNIGLRQTPVGGGSLSGVTSDTSGRLMISGTYLV